MEHANKQNLQFFDAPSMRLLYEKMECWQSENQKRFLSMSIHKESDVYACIALTNPSEVVIVCRDGANGKYQEVGRWGDKLLVKSH